MKQFFQKIALLAAIAALLFTAIELYIRTIPNTYKIKNELINHYGQQAEVLILGNSQTYFGIDPQYIPNKTAVNMANVSQTLKYDLAILKTFLKSNHQLSHVIVPISYANLFEEFEHTSESWRISYYYLYMNTLNLSVPFKYHMEIFNPQIAREKIMNHWANNSKPNCTNSGFGTDYSLEKKNLSHWENGKQRAARNTFANKRDTIYTQKHLNEIAQLCSDQHIQLILVTLPAHHSFTESIDKQQMQTVYKIVSDTKQKYPTIQYHNLLNDERFNDNDYYDSDHLSNIGAKKLTQILFDNR